MTCNEALIRKLLLSYYLKALGVDDEDRHHKIASWQIALHSVSLPSQKEASQLWAVPIHQMRELAD